jgi:ribosomal protein L11 methyltransferase
VTQANRIPERWFEISLGVGVSELDAATGLLAAAGHSGCEIIEHDAERGEIRVHVRSDSVAEARASLREIEATLERIGVGTAALEEIDERIWREDWKRHFRRTRVGRRLVVVAPWETDEPQSDSITIVINPGLAFGTGQHETTAGCLELLERIVEPGATVADVGCGSGILAIAAAKLGAARVVAIDNDPEAVNSAKENCVLNAMGSAVEIKLAQGPPAEGRFDVVVANILAETLAEMAAGLTSCVKPNGRLVLSGIESERRRLVEVAFSAEGWRLSQAIERSGWTSLVLARRAGEGA